MKPSCPSPPASMKTGGLGGMAHLPQLSLDPSGLGGMAHLPQLSLDPSGLGGMAHLPQLSLDPSGLGGMAHLPQLSLDPSGLGGMAHLPQLSLEPSGLGGMARLPRLFLSLALIFFVSGCAVLPALEPAPHQTVSDAPIPPSLSFTMSDGMVLPARAWLPPAGVPSRGVILALHGFTDSRDGWEIPAPGFAADGYAVFAPDQRGFGGTADRGGWAGSRRMVDDVVELMAQLRARYPGARLVLMGESMGGAVAALVAARPGYGPDATVLLAPAVWGPKQMDPAVFATLVVADAVAPEWVPNPGRLGDEIWASDNVAALMRFGRDPLTLREVSVRSLRGLVTLMGQAHDAMAHVRGPVLVLDGRRDQLVPPRATASAWAGLPAGVRRGFYPNGYHLLLRDRDRALVEADVLAWLDDPDQWLPSGADVAAAAWRADHAWQGGVSALAPASDDGGWQDKVWPY
jgi:acylglycerol lipase